MSRLDAGALPPGPRLPGALQLLATWKRPAGSMERLRARYGKRFTVKLPFQPPFVILSDPDEIRELFMASPAPTRSLGPLLPSLRRFNELSQRADGLIFELVEERRAAASGNGRGDDVLAMLLAARHEDDSPMSDQEIRDELMTALVAGHETT